MTTNPIKVDLSNAWLKDLSKEPSHVFELKQPKVIESQSVPTTTGNTENTENKQNTIKKTKKKTVKEKPTLTLIHNEENCYEIGIDEAGRGPMLDVCM